MTGSPKGQQPFIPGMLSLFLTCCITALSPDAIALDDSEEGPRKDMILKDDRT